MSVLNPAEEAVIFNTKEELFDKMNEIERLSITTKDNEVLVFKRDWYFYEELGGNPDWKLESTGGRYTASTLLYVLAIAALQGSEVSVVWAHE